MWTWVLLMRGTQIEDSPWQMAEFKIQYPDWLGQHMRFDRFVLCKWLGITSRGTPGDRSMGFAMAACGSICSWFGKLLEKLLLAYFFFMSLNSILIDAQVALPAYLFPKLLRDIVDWYVREYGDYLVKTKPSFFVGLVLVEIFVQWPLVIASLYGILTGKSWARTTCLAYGVCTATTMAPVLADLYASEQASNELVSMYIPFLIFPLIAIGRGLVPLSSSNSSFVASSRKETKRA